MDARGRVLLNDFANMSGMPQTARCVYFAVQGAGAEAVQAAHAECCLSKGHRAKVTARDLYLKMICSIFVAANVTSDDYCY